MIATANTYTVLEIRPAGYACPMCGRELPSDFYVLYRVRGEPLQLMDPEKIGGHVIKSGGKAQQLRPIEVVRLR